MARGGTSEESASSGTAKEQREQPSARHGDVIFGRAFDFFEMRSESGGFIHRFI